jgi:hypothetical protein
LSDFLEGIRWKDGNQVVKQVVLDVSQSPELSEEMKSEFGKIVETFSKKLEEVRKPVKARPPREWFKPKLHHFLLLPLF